MMWLNFEFKPWTMLCVGIIVHFRICFSQFYIPILTPTEVEEYLNDAYSGTQLYIHLIGHTSFVGAARKENWYWISNLEIHGR